MYKKIKRYINKNGGFTGAVKQFSSSAKEHGFGAVMSRALNLNKTGDEAYKIWLKNNEKTYTKEEIEKRINEMTIQPKISFLIPVYNVGEEYLRACIDSIVNQYYPNWELCVADDKSTDAHIRPILEEYMKMDNRIKVVFREENGHISAATNSAIEIATGEYVALVDNDDTIRPEALLEIVTLINEHPDADMIYTDEDKIDETGKIRIAPFFKPDWSPDAFWGHMYLCHLGVYRLSIAKKIGGFRIGYEGSQDYDFALRFSEQTDAIYHVPQILYHWRMLPTSTASSADNKDYAYDASIKTKKSALKRRKYDAAIEIEFDKRSTNIVFNPHKDDMVSIIIPTKNHGIDVKKCVDSIYQKSTWKNFEIILVDNGSDDEESLQLFEKYNKEHNNFRILKLDIPFNYSTLNNEAAKVAAGEFLLFLNNDTEVISENWLERMIGQAKLPYTGAVGAKLYYADDRVQHAGIIILDGAPVHAFLGFNRDDLGYFGRLSLNYNYLAVTGAAMMVEKAKFNQVGGFNEKLAIAYNDVDLCIRLYDKGYFNVCRADVELYHYESQSRGYDDTSDKTERLNKERSYLQELWYDKYLKEDPFYNKNLSDKFADFSLKKKI